MKQRNRSYILLEIMLSLLIFSVAAWICLTLFASGAQSSRLAKELSNAPTVAASALERARHGDIGATADTANVGYTYYTAEWQLCDEQSPEHEYTLTMGIEPGEVLTGATASISRASDAKVIYELTTAFVREGAAQ